MATPKLRFKEFDGDWSLITLNQLSTKIGDGIHATPKYDESGTIPFINGNNLVNGKVVINENTKRISNEEFQKYNQVLSDRTLFLSINGTIGNLAFYKNEKVLLGKSVCFINLKNGLDKKFIYLLLQSPQLTKTLNSELTGTTIKNLSLATVRNSEFYCPIEAEQTKIASFLSNVDEKISQLTQKHALLSQYKQGMMQKLFSQQLRFKADDGSEFGEWEDKPLNEIASKRSGKNKDGSISEVLTNSATQGIIKQSDYFEREIVTESNLNGYYIVNLDDFVYNPRISVHAPVGPIKRNKKCLGVMSPLYTVFTVSEGNLAYLEYFFDSNFWHDYVKGVANSGARHDRMNITNKDFFDMPIFYPCLEEQTKIANFLSSIDQKIEVVAQQIEQAKTWKKGLLQQMFV